MSIIETHLFSQYVGSGIPANLASLSLTVYGIFTMLGAVITGFLGEKLRMKNVLAGVYGIRIFIGHQLGAFASAWLGGILVSTTLGYTALWIVDLCLCMTAAIASFQIRD